MNAADIVVIAVLVAVVVAVMVKCALFKGPKWERDMHRRAKEDKR